MNNHLKLTNMTGATNVNSGRVYKYFINVKKEPSLNIEKSTACMECGNAFTKGHLNACPVKEKIGFICKYERHFGRLCRSKGRRPSVKIVKETVNNQNCSYYPEVPQATTYQNFCGVIKAWTEEGTGDSDDYSVLNIRRIYDTNCLETKKQG